MKINIERHVTTLDDARSSLQYLMDTETFTNVEVDPEEHARYVAYATVQDYLDNRTND